MNKNDEILIEITSVANEGNGVGRYENIAVFVPFTVPGDIIKAKIVKVKKNYCYAKIVDIVQPSKLRVEPDCSSFTKCGGCVFRNISYESEIALKKQKAEDAVKRIGGINLNANDILYGQFTNRYRNKAQCPFDKEGNIGFFALRSHRVIPFSANECLLEPCEFDKIISVLTDFFKKRNISCYDEENKTGVLRHLYLRKAFSTGEIMVVLVINSDKLNCSKEFVEVLKSNFGEQIKTVILNFNKNDTNVILGKENKVLYGQGYITDILCGIKIRISPFSFYQVNREMAEVLYKKAAFYADAKDKKILDLYCGAGTIGLSMANIAKEIIGVEIVKEAVDDAKFNADNNNIKNARFICSDALNAAKILADEKIKPDVVVVDPPRKGCDEELLDIIANNFCPLRLVYISCNPATFARDCAVLKKFGYNLIEYTPVDLFPRTDHVEVVALLTKEL